MPALGFGLGVGQRKIGNDFSGDNGEGLLIIFRGSDRLAFQIRKMRSAPTNIVGQNGKS